MIRKLKKSILLYLMNSYKKKKQQNFDTSLKNCMSTIRTMLHKTKYCFLISNGNDGWSSTRLVQPIIGEDDFVIWFGTNPNLRKVSEIKNNPKVTLAFEDKKENANLVLYGKATIETNLSLRKQYWKGEWKLFYPGGPKSDDYTLIRFEASHIELMNFYRNVLCEPFGLKPTVLRKIEGKWRIDSN